MQIGAAFSRMGMWQVYLLNVQLHECVDVTLLQKCAVQDVLREAPRIKLMYESAISSNLMRNTGVGYLPQLWYA